MEDEGQRLRIGNNSNTIVMPCPLANFGLDGHKESTSDQ